MDDLVDGKLVGHVGTHEVLLVRSGSELFAVGAHCTHYHGPLADGIVVGHTVRCPWHHACFDLRSSEAVRAPALAPVDCWTVEQRDGRIFVKGKREPARAPAQTMANAPKNRDRRRRRSGLRRRRDAATTRFRRQYRHAKPGRRASG
jgi:nitrite reductase/ring-hydroxylating ferredoxin subunit